MLTGKTKRGVEIERTLGVRKVIPTKKWVVIAHRLGARIFEVKGSAGPLRLVEEFENPQGNLRERDTGSDRPGRSSVSWGKGRSGRAFGNRRHALASEVSQTDRVASKFAKLLAKNLEKARTDKSYTSLILIAEPRFLGVLKAALGHATVKQVEATVERDFGEFPYHALPKRLDSLMAEFKS